eukprot:6469019-Amphidinium_carterae.1
MVTSLGKRFPEEGSLITRSDLQMQLSAGLKVSKTRCPGSMATSVPELVSLLVSGHELQLTSTYPETS